MAEAGEVIITCAVTGAIHTPSMWPHLPVSANEIADAAIGAAEASAAIIQLHARDPKDGRPDQSAEAFGVFLPRIEQGTKAVVNLTTGGSPYTTVGERIKPAMKFKPEFASLNMGSISFGLVPMLDWFKTFKPDWECQQLEGMGGNVRVGLEDSLWIGPGQPAKTNDEQVRLARPIIEALGLAIATRDEVGDILALKGGEKAAF